MKTYQIKDKDVTMLDAASIEVQELVMEFEDILAPRIVGRLREVQRKIRQGLFGVRLHQEAEWNRKFDYFSNKQEELQLNTTWSIFEVDDLDAMSGITGTRLVYNGWGEAQIDMPPGDKTWAEMWRYAEHVLNEADEFDHRFIESFDVSADQPGVVFLRTGS